MPEASDSPLVEHEAGLHNPVSGRAMLVFKVRQKRTPKFMNNLSIHGIALAMAICSTPAASEAADPVELTFATIEPPSPPCSEMSAAGIGEVNAASNGTLGIELFPGGALGQD